MKSTLTRRLALSLFAGATLLATGASAQTFPERIIKMVVPYPAGGPTDVIARIVAEEMGKTLGQNVIVENLAGASGAVGTRAVARAEPDGYTIVFGNNQTHGNNMFLLKEPGYDAIKDFAPLAGAGAFEHVFVVSNMLPVKSIQELIALAKADPGKLNYGSTGVGSGSHLATELFMTRTGIKMTHVPFRGAAPLVTELMAGRIDVSNSTLPSVLAQFQAGEMRAIGACQPATQSAGAGCADLARAGHHQCGCGIMGCFLRPGEHAETGSRQAFGNDPGNPEQARGQGPDHQVGLHVERARPGSVQALPRQGNPDLGGCHQGGQHRARGQLIERPLGPQEVSMGADHHLGRLIDHIHLRVADLETSRAFYRAVLSAVGRSFTSESASHFACDELWVDKADGPVSRVHLAFQAEDRHAVAAFHAAAVAHGGIDNGAPGERDYHPGYYAAFALDPDGNNIEAVFHGPAERSADSVVVQPRL